MGAGAATYREKYMFKTLQSTWPKDGDLPERSYRIGILARVLDGTIYDMLPNAFHDEKNEADEYVPLRQRRPCARYNLCRVVVDDSVSLLFSEGHFPEVEHDDKTTKDALQKLVKECRLNELMIDSATRGSVGSVAIFFRVIEGRVFLASKGTQYLTPDWNPKVPDTLAKVVEQYKVKGCALKDAGYTIGDDDLAADFWLRTEWDANAERAFLPVKVSKTEEPKFTKDDARSVEHKLGFVPVVWVKNLPGGDEIDGSCTFQNDVIDTSIEIDYLLSQNGRGLKYTMDPTLIIKEPAMGNNGEMIKGAGNAIVVSKDGDAKMLEINGTASDALINFVRFLRELALEGAHGNRANADKLSAAQSGRAMELMNQALIWLADKLRIAYGEGALRELLMMMVKASDKLPLKYKNGSPVGKLEQKGEIVLRWPSWYQPTAQDAENKANTLRTHTDAGHMSRETAVKAIAADYDIEDVRAEITAIEKEEAARNAEAQKQVKIQK